MSLGARLMARDLMQLGSPRNSPDGLAATGQGIGASYGPDRWRDCVDVKAGITGAPLENAEEPRSRQDAEDWRPVWLLLRNSITPSSSGNALLRHARCCIRSQQDLHDRTFAGQTREDVGWRAAVARALFVDWHSYQTWLVRLQTRYSSHSVIVAMWSGGGCNVPGWDLDGP
jgi:hypothetical protein